MKEENIRRIVSRQRAFFETGATLPVAYRLEALKLLKNRLARLEQDLLGALYADLGKSASKVYVRSRTGAERASLYDPPHPFVCE